MRTCVTEHDFTKDCPECRRALAAGGPLCVARRAEFDPYPLASVTPVTSPKVKGPCKGCKGEEFDGIVVNQWAGGIGDGLQGLLAVRALAEENPGVPILYRCGRAAQPFVSLFKPYARIGTRKPEDGERDKSIRQMNLGYRAEVVSRGRTKRWERYARNVGVRGPALALPELRDRAVLASLGEEFAGAVALAPRTADDRHREFPESDWHALALSLLAAGYRIVAVDRRGDRLGGYPCETLLGAPPARLAGAVLSAGCVVGVDSGPVHLAGVLGVPAVALCRQFPGAQVFGCYPSVAVIDGQTLDVAKVLAAVGKVARPMGETLKAHGRRVREGWYDRWIDPLKSGLDIGCGREPVCPTWRRWDHIYGDGDAATLPGLPSDSFATVYASHVLEHLPDPTTAIQRWYQVLAPGGHLIILVPSMELYEGKRDLPSRWNGDHKTYWIAEQPDPDAPPHVWGLRQAILQAVPNAEVVELRMLDEGHSYPDKRRHPVGEYSIEAIVRKPA